MPYDINVFKYNNNTIYSLNNLIRIAFKNNDKINLNLSAPIKDKNNIINECDINDVDKYINADINIIGLLCSCHMINNQNNQNNSNILKFQNNSNINL